MKKKKKTKRKNRSVKKKFNFKSYSIYFLLCFVVIAIFILLKNIFKNKEENYQLIYCDNFYIYSAIGKEMKKRGTVTEYYTGTDNYSLADYLFNSATIRLEYDERRSREDIKVDWLSEDDLFIFNFSSNMLVSEFSFNFDSSPEESIDVCEDDINAFLKDADRVMIDNGFENNSRNTTFSNFTFSNYKTHYDNSPLTRSYKRGQTRCVLELNFVATEVVWPEGFSFVCFDDFDKNYEEQLPFLEYFKDSVYEDFFMKSIKKDGDFAFVETSNSYVSIDFIFKKIDGSWETIDAIEGGSDTAKCQYLIKYAVPKTIYDKDCVDLNTWGQD